MHHKYIMFEIVELELKRLREENEVLWKANEGLWKQNEKLRKQLLKNPNKLAKVNV